MKPAAQNLKAKPGKNRSALHTLIQGVEKARRRSTHSAARALRVWKRVCPKEAFNEGKSPRVCPPRP